VCAIVRRAGPPVKGRRLNGAPAAGIVGGMATRPLLVPPGPLSRETAAALTDLAGLFAAFYGRLSLGQGLEGAFGREGIRLALNLNAAPGPLTLTNTTVNLLNDTVDFTGSTVTGLTVSGTQTLVPGGRLSVSSTDPAADGFSGGGGGVYYLPYLHDQVQLYVSGAWTSVPINTGVDASSGAHVNTTYDVFAYYDGAVMQLERLAWKKVTASNSPTAGASKVVNLADTVGLAVGMKVLLRETGGAFNEAVAYITAVVANTSITVDSLAVGLTTPDVYGYPARATGLSRQNGRLVKSGDATRLYLGTFYALDGTDGPSGSGVYNNQTGRTLWNQYNRLRRPLKVAEAADSWSYNTAAIRPANNSLANRVWLVNGMAAGPHLSLHLAALVGSTGAGLQSALIGDNSTTAAAADCLGMAAEPSNYVGQARATLETAPGLGVHYYQWLERGSGSGTVTWYGDNGTPTYLQSGLGGGYDC
jgi:hypothetical protein